DDALLLVRGEPEPAHHLGEERSLVVGHDAVRDEHLRHDETLGHVRVHGAYSTPIPPRARLSACGSPSTTGSATTSSSSTCAPRPPRSRRSRRTRSASSRCAIASSG